MLTVRLKKRPTLNALQGPFEASILNKRTWRQYAWYLERIVKKLGRDKHPDDVVLQDVLDLKAYLLDELKWTPVRTQRAISIIRAFYQWMNDMQLIETNPFRKKTPRAERPVEVILE